ncbi:uncharacterized mitochondrial protein AtMg00310-like [Alnus glutinosa]|uniref:uncharacterized mitochondrial protein AtMg00310-like n=1 Tax=Alnus glutinosa TaxID=3517 RepID=UPI002D78A1C6|nr:uncharacterized mitochondrial protein AtMg00310-like [Alnus glutinosa]
MSVFKLPKTLCTNLEKVMNMLMWGNTSSSKGLKWMKWSRLGQSKLNGGLGYRDLEVFNLSLLAKQGWRLIQDLNPLVGRIMNDKYFPRGSFLLATLGHNPSFSWRNILKARPVLENGLIWRVGNGEKIRIWGDKWLPNSYDFLVHSPPNGLDNEDKVCSLIDPLTSRWKTNILGEYFDPVEVEMISRLIPGPLL